MAEKEQITVAEAGRRGGIATRDRRGIEFLRQIAKKGGETTKKRWGHLFGEFGRRGGRPKRSNLESVGEEDRNQKEAGRPSDPLLPSEL